MKIENILISKTGNIKIIDFGLSNLFSPHSNLTTFCGSLYFAAPELLNAKVYTGPEVDVWSFGIVLYVLVCGKVPFDDQSMPALHAKIKRGQVEYPVWLSGECKHILSRMLVTNPQQRATLSELMSHPWMVKAYEGPPEVHLPKRLPLRAGELDPEVVKGMTGFEFGTPEDIEAHMNEILTSEMYLQTLAQWDAKHGGSPSASFTTNGSSNLSGSLDGSAALGRASTRNSLNSSSDKAKTGSRRFSGIDFYRKKAGSLFGGKDDPLTPSSSNSVRTAIGPGGGIPTPLDPIAAYHPLFSIYYLVKEKMERERLYGHSFFASSNVSLTKAPAASSSAAAAVGGGSSMPTAADIPQEELRMPETSHTSSRAKETLPRPNSLAAPPRAMAPAAMAMPSAPTPVFDSREKSQPLPNMAGPPRARATGADLEEALRTTSLSPRPDFAPPGSAPGTFDSNHKRSASLSVRRPSSQSAEPAATSASARYGRTVAQREPTRQSVHVIGGLPVSAPPADEGDSSAQASGSLVRRFGSLMSRSPSAPLDAEAREKRRANRMSMPSGPQRRVTPTAELDGVLEGDDTTDGRARGKAFDEPDSGDEMLAVSPPKPLPPKPSDGSSPGAATDHSGGYDTIGRAAGQPMSPKRRQSTLLGLRSPAQEFPVAAAGEIGGWQGPSNPAQAAVLPSSSKREQMPKGSKEQTASKPIFLKGLFSVQTTSTKPRAAIHATLVQVLDRLGVQYREIKGGYECVHLPSLDFSGAAQGMSSTGNGNMRLDENETQPSLDPPRPKRKSSKLSFTNRSKRDGSESRGSLNGAGGGAEESSMHTFPRSRTNSVAEGDLSAMSTRPSGTPAAIVESSQEQAAETAPASKAMSANAVEQLAVRFEIFVVKVPLLLGVNGLQFRRVSGNPWQYQMLAKRVLEDAKVSQAVFVSFPFACLTPPSMHCHSFETRDNVQPASMCSTSCQPVELHFLLFDPVRFGPSTITKTRRWREMPGDV